MRILITGGAGCLGSNLTERYLEAGHSVCILDNFATGQRGSLPEEHPQMTIVEGTVYDRALVDRVFADFAPTHVIHSAAAYKDPDNWIEDTRTNVEGTIHVAEASRRAGVKRFVNFHTALGYGRPDTLPIPVSAPARPFTSYGISKQAGENYLAISGLPYVSLRLANVTGPRLAIGPIPTFYTRLKAGKACFCSKTVRDFIDMDDFFSIMDLVMEEGAPTGVFNVSTGTGHAIKEIFDIVVDHLGITLSEPVPEVEPGADDVPAVVLDPSETIRTFGWQPQYTFAQTIRRMLEWYDRHGVTAIYSHLKAPVPAR
ncbi:NAD-dependent epimerase/dehydratase family protein [Microvirga thermotolerans]|uniref:NAD-dependent epimerase/dehydratase family protein n=1 Tax=Microvirga thermotolerans TaxID=2651334 RepID=A0A5P9K119_9HYPH|nr:NAD-dependent epimerase/dehydratase family protein [Microvirga thermotolerans]QFU15924.1 NAD-dependent epimerase/dehydratase family protein [Microvirga thermotolerans]